MHVLERLDEPVVEREALFGIHAKLNHATNDSRIDRDATKNAKPGGLALSVAALPICAAHAGLSTTAPLCVRSTGPRLARCVGVATLR